MEAIQEAKKLLEDLCELKDLEQLLRLKEIMIGVTDVHRRHSYIYYMKYIFILSKKSPTGPTERTPKPEYLAVATYFGVRW